MNGFHIIPTVEFFRNFSVFLKKLNSRQQQKISLHTSVSLNSERESHVLETLDRDLSRKNNFTSSKEELNNLRLKNPNRLICAHLNINSVKNKFDLLSDIIENNIDILMISETKLDSWEWTVSNSWLF